MGNLEYEKLDNITPANLPTAETEALKYHLSKIEKVKENCLIWLGLPALVTLPLSIMVVCGGPIFFKMIAAAIGLAHMGLLTFIYNTSPEKLIKKPKIWLFTSKLNKFFPTLRVAKRLDEVIEEKITNYSGMWENEDYQIHVFKELLSNRERVPAKMQLLYDTYTDCLALALESKNYPIATLFFIKLNLLLEEMEGAKNTATTKYYEKLQSHTSHIEKISSRPELKTYL